MEMEWIENMNIKFQLKGFNEIIYSNLKTNSFFSS